MDDQRTLDRLSLKLPYLEPQLLLMRLAEEKYPQWKTEPKTLPEAIDRQVIMDLVMPSKLELQKTLREIETNVNALMRNKRWNRVERHRFIKPEDWDRLLIFRDAVETVGIPATKLKYRFLTGPARISPKCDMQTLRKLEEVVCNRS